MVSRQRNNLFSSSFIKLSDIFPSKANKIMAMITISGREVSRPSLNKTVLKLPLSSQANIVDLGTGTGAIALALASERPQWQVTATDIYAPTLAVAQDNAVRHGLMQVNFACGAWFEALEQQQFDLIVSNPPFSCASIAN